MRKATNDVAAENVTVNEGGGQRPPESFEKSSKKSRKCIPRVQKTFKKLRKFTQLIQKTIRNFEKQGKFVQGRKGGAKTQKTGKKFKKV